MDCIETTRFWKVWQLKRIQSLIDRIPVLDNHFSKTMDNLQRGDTVRDLDEIKDRVKSQVAHTLRREQSAYFGITNASYLKAGLFLG